MGAVQESQTTSNQLRPRATLPQRAATEPATLPRAFSEPSVHSHAAFCAQLRCFLLFTAAVSGILAGGRPTSARPQSPRGSRACWVRAPRRIAILPPTVVLLAIQPPAVRRLATLRCTALLMTALLCSVLLMTALRRAESPVLPHPKQAPGNFCRYHPKPASVPGKQPGQSQQQKSHP
jgi:hypothetical protein